MNLVKQIIPSAIAAAFLCTTAFADQGFQLANQNPLTAIHGLPKQLSADKFLKPGHHSVSISLDASSHFIKKQSGDDSLLIDGETLTAEISVEFALSETFHWGLRIPYVSHSGGFLDSTVDAWHELTGLPDGGRSTEPTGQLNYVYVKDGVTAYQLNQDENSAGDITAFAHWLQSPGESWQLGYNAQLKAPTGKASSLSGSEASALALWADLATTEKAGKRLHHNFAGGISFHDRGEILSQQQRNIVPFVSYTGAWRWSDTTTFKGQIYGHGAVWNDSEVSAFTQEALQGALGINWDYSNQGGYEYELALVEDLLVRTAPDVSLIFTITQRVETK
jgi:hypothetical protein